MHFAPSKTLIAQRLLKITFLQVAQWADKHSLDCSCNSHRDCKLSRRRYPRNKVRNQPFSIPAPLLTYVVNNNTSERLKCVRLIEFEPRGDDGIQRGWCARETEWERINWINLEWAVSVQKNVCHAMPLQMAPTHSVRSKHGCKTSGRYLLCSLARQLTTTIASWVRPQKTFDYVSVVVMPHMVVKDYVVIPL